MKNRLSSLLSRTRRGISQQKRKRRLKNHNFTIISNTCVGGVIYNALGERFNSPTINLVIWEEEFLTFCNNLRKYSQCSIQELAPIESGINYVSYPVGLLKGKEYNLPDITVRFVHYHSFEEAKQKWESRFKRVNYNNIFIIMERGMNPNEVIMDEFESLPYKNKVFLSSITQSERWPHNYNFSFYTEDRYVEGNIYNMFNIGVYQYRWLDEFDYVTWLNSGIIQTDRYISRHIKRKTD